MKERPILMQEAMGRAAHHHQKFVTRRPFKPQPPNIPKDDRDAQGCLEFREHGGPGTTGQFRWLAAGLVCQKPPWNQRWECPYGVPGDKLWIREPHFLRGEWVKDGLTKTGRTKWWFVVHRGAGAMFPDDRPEIICTKKTEEGWFRRNSIFMPRWASRTEWIIKSITAERVQQITEQQARSEGFSDRFGHDGYRSHSAVHCFIEAWDAIYDTRPRLKFEANPWVWRIAKVPMTKERNS